MTGPSVIAQPTYEQIRQARQHPTGVLTLLLSVLDDAVPPDWHHELTKREYGAWWNRLRDVLETAIAQIELDTFSRRGQDVKTYAVDELLTGFAWDLDTAAVAATRTAGGAAGTVPADLLAALASRMRDAALGLRNYRAEPITDDGKVVIVGHTDGAKEVWPDKRRPPVLEYRVSVDEAAVEMSPFDVLRHAYERASRALEQKRRNARLMLQPGPTVIELVVRREIAR